jgi:exodeoxyribonuclease VII small subunit
MAQTPHELKYEEALARLDKLVAELESSDLDLEARFKKFEDALKTLGALTKKLEQGKKKVEVLIKTHLGEPSTTPFDDAGASDADDEEDAAS